MSAWDLLWTDDSLYLLVSCVVSALLVVTEMALLRLREKAILGHLGWKDRDLDGGPGACD